MRPIRAWQQYVEMCQLYGIKPTIWLFLKVGALYWFEVLTGRFK